MTHVLALLICIASVEIFVRSNFVSIFFSLLKVKGKVLHVLSHKKISDHWKERALPAYALNMMKYSFQMLLILSGILSLFFMANFFLNDFLNFSLSLIGITEAAVFALGYLQLRKFFIR